MWIPLSVTPFIYKAVHSADVSAGLYALALFVLVDLWWVKTIAPFFISVLMMMYIEDSLHVRLLEASIISEAVMGSSLSHSTAIIWSSLSVSFIVLHPSPTTTYIIKYTKKLILLSTM